MEIIKVTPIPCECWYEKDITGTIHIKMKHEDLPEPFTIIQMFYNYSYTSNAHQEQIIKEIGKLLGFENIERR